jgi:hypothetical protein
VVVVAVVTSAPPPPAVQQKVGIQGYVVGFIKDFLNYLIKPILKTFLIINLRGPSLGLTVHLCVQEPHLEQLQGQHLEVLLVVQTLIRLTNVIYKKNQYHTIIKFYQQDTNKGGHQCSGYEKMKMFVTHVVNGNYHQVPNLKNLLRGLTLLVQQIWLNLLF